MINQEILLTLLAGIIIGGLCRHFLPRLPMFMTTRQLISKAQLKAIGCSSTDGFVIINNKGSIIHVNNALLNIFDYQSEQVLNQNITLLISKAEASQHDNKIAESIASNGCT